METIDFVVIGAGKYKLLVIKLPQSHLIISHMPLQ